MYCEKCGTQIDDDSVFCQKCGKKQTDTFNTSMEDNSEFSKTDKIEVGSMLYVIKSDMKLPPVGCKVKVTSKQNISGKEYISAIGPYKADGAPMAKVKKCMHLILLILAQTLRHKKLYKGVIQNDLNKEVGFLHLLAFPL